MSAATMSSEFQLPEVTVVEISATSYLMFVKAERQLSHSWSSCASSAVWLLVDASGACTVSVRRATAPSGEVAVTVIWNSTSAGRAGSDGAGVELGVAL